MSSLCIAPARKFPDLPIVVAHCGGMLFHEAILAAAICPNITLELSTVLSHQIMEVLAHVPADRLMIGSDLPENTGMEIGKIRSLNISIEQESAILSRTACRMFGVAEIPAV